MKRSRTNLFFTVVMLSMDILDMPRATKSIERRVQSVHMCIGTGTSEYSDSEDGIVHDDEEENIASGLNHEEREQDQTAPWLQ